MQEPRLSLVLCWHMHQPQYRLASDGRYALPWTYLHGIKDYTDMAAHLEAVPGARAVVNFSPVLLAQLDDYAQRIERWARERDLRGAGTRNPGDRIGDSLLDALVADRPPAGEERRQVLAACLKANETHMIRRFPRYEALADAARAELAGSGPTLDAGALGDLLVWYHLAWTGESVRAASPLIRDLQEKAAGFGLDERRALARHIGETLAEILPRYRRLAEEGRIELSVTPHTHPMLPLLIDFASAREALPESGLPAGRYPGGRERCRRQLERAVEVFERHFGFRPAGCWPSEGGVSDAALALLVEQGFRWAASGTNVLRHSLRSELGHQLYRPWECRNVGEAGGAPIACFFRDDTLSDLIGFTYSHWEAADAIDDLVQHLERIRRSAPGGTSPAVSIIMDGENAWEHFPRNGHDFLRGLYERLVEHPFIEMTTCSDVLAASDALPVLEHVTAGSWVYGNFAVWVGHPAKNRAWEWLCEAKRAADAALADGALEPERAAALLEQLAVCEGSDWFWWYGEERAAEEIASFDALYRRHLKDLYALAGAPAPAALDGPSEQPVFAVEDAGAMRRANQ